MKHRRRVRPARDFFYMLCHAALKPPVVCLAAVRWLNVPDVAGMGGVILACNHQSYLDPVLVGLGVEVPVHYMARRSLFRVPVFGAVIRATHAHPVSREGADSEALRTMIRVLRAGEPLLIFPEGTRTRDGALGRMRPGVGRLAARCAAPVVPVCIEGAFECWPRTNLLPRPARIVVAFGEPMRAHEEDGRELTDRIAAAILRMQRDLRRDLGRTD